MIELEYTKLQEINPSNPSHLYCTLKEMALLKDSPPEKRNRQPDISILQVGEE